MGFDWGVSVALHYCVPIKLHEKACVWYMLKRLAEYEPGYAKRAHEATVTGDPLAKPLQKRASQSIVVLIDSPEYCEDEVEKEVENPTPIEKRFHYNPRLDEREFDLEYNCPELLGEAFELAASKILGEDHGFTLKLFRGGCRGEAEAPGRERALLLTYKPSVIVSNGYIEDHIWLCHGGVNVPWGVQATTVPAAPAGVAQKMKQLMMAFGIEGEGDPGWRVVTVADGG